MENAEEIFHYLEDFSKRKPKVIPQELNDYLAYVARTGDPVYQWSLVKSLFKEKLLNVITEFYETTPVVEIPPYPNVDPFNYDVMKNSLTERLDSFNSAPFTVQRISELLTCPRKQYNRVDKFMRAVEKNILVVSTREPGIVRHPGPENGEPAEPIVNGSDNSEYNVDVEMEDMSWKENAEHPPSTEPQPSSSETRISVENIEARLKSNEEAPSESPEKTTQCESVTLPEVNVATDEPEVKPDKPTESTESKPPVEIEQEKSETKETVAIPESKPDVEMKIEAPSKDPLMIPEIKIDDADKTEERLNEESNKSEIKEETLVTEKEDVIEHKIAEEAQQSDENSSDSTMKDESPKIISEASTSSEESSSSSDNADGNSNSPKTDTETQLDVAEESNSAPSSEEVKEPEQPLEEKPKEEVVEKPLQIESDNYSISDVKSELPSVPETPKEEVKVEEVEVKVEEKVEVKIDEEPKAEICESTDKQES